MSAKSLLETSLSAGSRHAANRLRGVMPGRMELKLVAEHCQVEPGRSGIETVIIPNSNL
jgi:hypothetical protein